MTVSATVQVERERSDSVRQSQLAPDIKRLCASSRLQGRSVVTALNPPEVEFHVIEVPQAALSETSNAQQVIHWEIGRLAPAGSQDSVETRYWMLPPRSGGSHSTAIGVAAPTAHVIRLIDMIRSAGLRCTRVETAATALYRFGKCLRSWSKDELWGVLDLGARQSRLILATSAAPILIRHAGPGGQSWTERVADSLRISSSAAETQKRSHGIASSPRREAGSVQPSDQSDEVASLLLGALRSELNQMSAEIKRSYEYVLGSYPSYRAGDLILVGGGAGLPNLADFFSGVLGIPVRRSASYIGQAGCRLHAASAGNLPWDEFAVAIGLVLPEQDG